MGALQLPQSVRIQREGSLMQRDEHAPPEPIPAVDEMFEELFEPPDAPNFDESARRTDSSAASAASEGTGG
jgi:hypothetical protein